KHNKEHNDTILLSAGQGRIYHCGSMTAIFKADENETHEKYSVSEWWLEPNIEGPGPHLHEENDEMLYGIEGTMTFLVGDQWVDIVKGIFIRIPARTIHDFKNATNEKAGVLNFYIPGGFEKNMTSIVEWFENKK